MEPQERLIQIIEKNDMLMQVFDRVSGLGLESYYVGAGCIVQTVWNALTHRPLNYGIGDIDLVYFDDRDLSYEAEDQVIGKIQRRLADLPIAMDIKNQARVHLWYKDKYGIELAPYPTLERAIDTWPTTATAIAARKNEQGIWQVYAPFGFEDLFSLTVRANKKMITKEIYLKKADKWKAKWPELNVIPWA
ncbi:nucleotidyltransferase family protein [Paenibacillus macerans]|uniref:nucleotidyltransferase family protein n=1 Tax=Paenibacillus macerans TaxID=44252 RepID=UPI003D31D98E